MAKANAKEVEVETPNTDTNLVDVGDENEVETEVLLDSDEDENPNVADQLEASPADDEDKDDKEDKEDTRTPEEKLIAFLDENPDVSEFRKKDIKDRINKLTYEKNEATRREQAATDYARGVQTENAELKTKQQHQDGVFIGEHKSRLEAQLETAKNQYREAHEAGDASLLADANALIARTAAELAQAEQTETRFSRFVKTNPSPNAEVTPWQPPADPNAPAPTTTPDAKAEAWAERNKWFGEDEEMTKAALNIHQTLVTQEGYMPTANGYYAELDSRLRKNYPDKFTKPQVSGQQVVTPSSSATPGKTPKGKHKVRLSASQVAIAKKLGLTVEQYAKYV